MLAMTKAGTSSFQNQAATGERALGLGQLREVNGADIQAETLEAHTRFRC